MNENPKILIVSDEPMLLVDLLYELEGRGFTVVPGTSGDYANCTVYHDVDAAILDLRLPGDADKKFASTLRQSGIPLVMFGGGSSTIPVEISQVATCVAKPVDYDELTGTLHRLTARLPIGNPRARGGAIPLSQSITADKP